ncbi:EAL domain-containing protein [Mangrovibacillus cuniculi]|uniref:EAL domain-containing protein n=1 Tax=Mangrovibacillus cuniculi TaxID=2593652 RepID=A0A7S8C9T5_9BACI|nr:EAL domain-containing protein [Mangrovibacillus cuniculi]QPC46034.1 EAL domain-containing protein [Mangrovibacillus cuniculi]
MLCLKKDCIQRVVRRLIQTDVIYYEGREQFKQELFNLPIGVGSSILMQIIGNKASKETFTAIKELANECIPNVRIIGSNSDGGVVNGMLTEDKPVIVLRSFQHASVETAMLSSKPIKSLESRLEDLLSRIPKDANLLMVICSNLKVSSGLLLSSIRNKLPHVPVIGGVSSDGIQFHLSIVVTNEAIDEEGVAFCWLKGKELDVQTYIGAAWQKIGSPFTITSATGRILKEINGEKPVVILERYLGKTFINRLPESSLEFPFIVPRSGLSVALFIIKVRKDGSLLLNRGVVKGEEIRFAFPDVEDMVQASTHQVKKLAQNPPETILMFNCIARKKSFQNVTEEEVKNMQQLSPTSGMVSYGEIGSVGQTPTQLYAHSLAYVGISENQKRPSNLMLATKETYKLSQNDYRSIAFTNLIRAASNDVENLTSSIKLSEEYYRSLFDNNTDFVYSTDLKGRFTSVNPAFTKIFGFEKEEVIGKLALRYIGAEDISMVVDNFSKAIEGQEQFYDIKIRTATREKHVFHIKNIPITVNGKCVGVYGIGRNVSEQRKNELKIKQLAYYDQDTNLPNRAYFSDLVTKEIHNGLPSLSILFIDVDQFSTINDAFGHRAGDELVTELASRLVAIIPYNAFIGRFGNDKFTICILDEISDLQYDELTNSLLEVIREPYTILHQEVTVTASIGVSLYPKHGEHVTTLMHNADVALSEAKKLGGDRAVLFNLEMNDRLVHRLEMKNHLRKAIDQEELTVFYQPIYHLESQQIVGCEALLRWDSSIYGSVSPATFIPLAEETGLIVAIGKYVLKEACRNWKSLQKVGYDHLFVSVNVSAIQFQSVTFIDEIKAILHEYAVPPNLFHLELTESTMLQNIDRAIETLGKLKQLGVKVAIDDFGTGYSSLSYLKNLPISTLKVDKSFVQSLESGSADLAIVQSVITVAQGLNLETVAEGVETLEQQLLLEELNCSLAQGYYVAKPMPLDALLEWLKAYEISRLTKNS